MHERLLFDQTKAQEQSANKNKRTNHDHTMAAYLSPWIKSALLKDDWSVLPRKPAVQLIDFVSDKVRE